MKKLKKKELAVRWTKGSGPGGTNRNKLETCCVLTHKPTGLQSKGDERTRQQSYQEAYRALCERVEEDRAEKIARGKKARRDAAIKDRKRVRTYDYSRGVVTDHRTGRTASIKNVVDKGRLDLLR